MTRKKKCKSILPDKLQPICVHVHQKDCEQDLLRNQARHDPEECIVVHRLVFGAWPTFTEFDAKYPFELAWKMEQQVVGDEG